MTGRRLAFALALIAGPQLGAPITARAQSGDSLSVYLLTIGQGDAVWERFGHNAIGIRDHRTNTDIVYNWGLFDFASPGFVARFIKGEMTYWMAGSDAGSEITGYVTRNRDIVIQELNLSPRQRQALAEFVEWNAREENKYYRYDYFRDNCSTRVRDALDRVLGGAIRRAMDSVATPHSYRDHALRLMSPDRLTSTGIDIGLGRPSDRKITAWDEMFIPMRVRDRLRDVQVPDDSGRLVPLVAGERVVFAANRAAEATAEPNRGPLFLVVGTLVGGILLAAGRRVHAAAARTGAARSLGVFWSAIVGILGVLLVFLQVATEHVWAYWNLNSLAYSPLWLVVAGVLPFARVDAPSGRIARSFAAIGGILTMLALVIASLPPLRQDSLAVLCLVAPGNLAVALIVWRMFGARREAVV